MPRLLPGRTFITPRTLPNESNWKVSRGNDVEKSCPPALKDQILEDFLPEASIEQKGLYSAKGLSERSLFSASPSSWMMFKTRTWEPARTVR